MNSIKITGQHPNGAELIPPRPLSLREYAQYGGYELPTTDDEAYATPRERWINGTATRYANN